MTGNSATVPAAGARPSRLCLVLVGLLGMHGLASDHGRMAAAATMPAAASPAAALDPGMASLTLAAPVDSNLAAGAHVDLRSGGTGMVMAGLCLAVLTRALLLLAAAQRLLPSRAQPAGRLPSELLARPRALPPPRPPDLVAGLCVSRT